MANSFNNYTGDGATTDFAVTFSYISTSHIEVYKNGVLQTLTTHYTIQTSPSVEVQFVSPPANNDDIWIIRNSQIASPYVTYVGAATLTAADMNNHLLQNLYLEQERREQVDSGMIRVFSGSTAQTGILSGAWTILNGFNNVGAVARIAYPDHVNDKIVIPRAGVYSCKFQCSMDGTDAALFQLAPHLAGVKQNHITAQVQHVSDEVSLSAEGLISVVAGNELDLRVKLDTAGEVTLIDAQLEIVKIGE